MGKPNGIGYGPVMRLAALSGDVSLRAEVYGRTCVNYGGRSEQADEAYAELTAARDAMSAALIALAEGEG